MRAQEHVMHAQSCDVRGALVAYRRLSRGLPLRQWARVKLQKRTSVEAISLFFLLKLFVEECREFPCIGEVFPFVEGQAS